MINYDSFSGPPRRRRGKAPLAVFGFVVLLAGGVAALVLGRVLTPGASAASKSPGHSVAAVATPVTSAGTLTLGACIDPTGSIVSSFAPAIRRDLAQAIASLAPPAGKLPTNTISGGPVARPRGGVNLTVRQVNTNSFTSNLGPYMQTAVVPAVPGLASRPAPGAQGYLSQLQAWTVGYAEVKTARQAARSAAITGAATIARMPLDRNPGLSGISACVSGLLTTVPPGGTHSYLLASDLQENVPAQLAGSFHGAPLVIIQTCDTGNAAYCQQLLDKFTRKMRQLDVGRIIVIRPEVAGAAIDQWIRTGEATP